MHLKKIEITGFKSFAERTVIELESGMTSIVGPNGCGKSNVSDAMRWALGEQNPRLLRGNEMQDVIFIGSDERRGVGRAEVSVTIINDDQSLPIEFHEITVTRRLYRSGESQYLLNGTNCRLTDIRQLFMGTGIGTSSYFVMEQGKIDQILSGKPEDRRAVFEEAAGILKYKLQKKTALSRLESTDENLVRLGDIMREVKRQIISLERQAGKARRYKAYKDELKDLELRCAKKDQVLLAKDLESLLIKLNSTKDLKDSTLKEYESLKAELGNVQHHYDQNVDHMSSLEQQSIKISGDIDRKKQESAHIDESLVQLQQRLEHDHQEIKIAKERLERYEIQMASENERVQSSQDDYQKQDEDLVNKEQRIQDILKEIEQVEKQRDELKSLILDLSNQASMTKNLRSSLTEKMRMQLLRLEKVKAEQDRVKEMLELKKTETIQIETALESMNEKLIRVQSLLEELVEKKFQKRSVFENDTREYETLKTKIHQERFRHEILHRPHQTKTIEYIRGLMLKNSVLEGLDAGGYEILDQALSVPELYKTALFSVLGDKHAAVLLASWDSMGDLFLRLDASDRGGIHYLCLGQENLAFLMSEEIKSIDGVLGFLKDHITYEPRFKHAIELLMGDVVLVRDLQALTNLAKNKSKNFRIVSVQGDYLDRDGVITCAQIDDKAMSFEPVQFEEKIDSLEEQLRVKGQEKDQIHNDLKRLELEEQQARMDCHELELACAKHTGEKEHYQHKIQELTEEVWELSQEESILEQDLSAWEKELSDSDPLLQKIEEDISAGNSQLQSFDFLVSTNEVKKQKCLMDLAEVRVISKEAQDRNARLMEHHNELVVLMSETTSTITRREEEIHQIRLKMDELRNRKIRVDQDQGPLLSEQERVQEKKIAMANIIEQMREQLAILKDKSLATHSALDDLNSMIQDLEIRKNELSMKHDALIQRFKERYEMDIVPLPYAEEERDTNQDQIRIKELDEKIRNMGEVNVLAIGEYDTLKERHQFLELQHNDLIRAKEGIVKAIQKINKTSKEMFLETFIQVRESFREIYRMLFGGGRADISLTDDQAILESGIEVVAQPPGKKLQNITLLSGGERTLTALALLLSIFKVKPSPFCFMDEMDAALDESNIGRFLNLLSEFKKSTQFVVITHSKKTISLADAIYGVTMEESGVSKVYSMKMPEREPAQQEALPA